MIHADVLRFGFLSRIVYTRVVTRRLLIELRGKAEETSKQNRENRVRTDETKENQSKNEPE